MDQEQYIYMCDIHQTDRLFAIRREEHCKFKNIYQRFSHSQDVIDNMPESLTVQVYPMAEIDKDKYILLDPEPVNYQVKRMYYIVPGILDS
jgi:hypothetical protein